MAEGVPESPRREESDSREIPSGAPASLKAPALLQPVRLCYVKNQRRCGIPGSVSDASKNDMEQEEMRECEYW